MKTRDAIKGSTNPNNTPTNHSRGYAGKFIPLLLLLMLSATVQAQFHYTVSQGKVTISRYTGPGGAVTIPDTIDGLPVTSIGGMAFYYCTTNLTSVTIPDSVTSIAGGAFWGCTGLASVTIGSGVTSIGEGTFRGCTGLTNVTIPDGVTSIEAMVFLGCTGLASMTIPDSVTSIGEHRNGVKP